MNYNCNHIIEYNNIKEDELKMVLQIRLLKCFNVESYDDTIDKSISLIYEKTKNIRVFISI